MTRQIRSTRRTPTIEAIFAIVTQRDGIESVVRRDTPYGTQPLSTDDAALIPAMLALAQAEGFDDGYVARFDRVHP